MQPVLRFVQTPDLHLHPEDLFQKLESSAANFDEIVRDLNCSLDQLKETLHADETRELLHLKTQLAALRAQLIATRYVPLAVAKLAALMSDAEKPEVKRRAATGILHIAGIPTTTNNNNPITPPIAPPPPPPPPPKLTEDIPPEEDTPELRSLMTLVSFCTELFDKSGFPRDITSNLPPNAMNAVIDALRPFYTQNTNYPCSAPALRGDEEKQVGEPCPLSTNFTN
ncbi:MAG: hypothetical protein FWD53_03730 [Phycisphaerales bacterium]|nr:hypothetical protein [Phycisphaerales bacterium]